MTSHRHFSVDRRCRRGAFQDGGRVRRIRRLPRALPGRGDSRDRTCRFEVTLSKGVKCGWEINRTGFDLSWLWEKLHGKLWKNHEESTSIDRKRASITHGGSCGHVCSPFELPWPWQPWLSMLIYVTCDVWKSPEKFFFQRCNLYPSHIIYQMITPGQRLGDEKIWKDLVATGTLDLLTSGGLATCSTNQ